MSLPEEPKSLELRNWPWQKHEMNFLFRKFFQRAKSAQAAKEVLRLEKERFDVLVSAVKDYAIFTLDRDGYVQSWNEGAQRFKGYEPHEILGKHFSIFYPEKPRLEKYPEKELEIAKKEGRFEDEGLRVRKDGATFWANVVITAIYDREGNHTGFLKVTRDMTERKKAEEELKKLNEELEQRVKERTASLIMREADLKKAKEIAEAANDAKTSFVANMSHEIRTPLGAILGFSELLTDDGVSDEEKKMAHEAIKRNGQLLTDLINDILDLSKVEANKLEIDYSSVEIHQLLAEVESAFKLRAETKGISFKVEISPELPEKIWTDALRLKQILFNVISNAIKFTRQGEVGLHVYLKNNDGIYFEVRDTGIGISQENIKNLFAPFKQADSSITREFGGTGLGLILSKRLAQALGGDLVLKESHPNKGSIFCAHIRLMKDEVESTTPSAPSQNYEKNLFAGKKVLIVDDNPDNRTLIGHLFKPYGIVCENAVDGLKGVEMAQRWDPDLILMDLQMPVMGGLNAMLELRKKGYNKPIMAVTAHALKEEKEKCLAMGFNAYITKPIDKNLLFQTLLKFFKS